MTISTMEDHAPAHSGGTKFWSWLRQTRTRPRPGRSGVLDPRDLSGHLQRDLGFLDGNEVYVHRSTADERIDGG